MLSLPRVLLFSSLNAESSVLVLYFSSVSSLIFDSGLLGLLSLVGFCVSFLLLVFAESFVFSEFVAELSTVIIES